jgi:hypothetical protein
MAGRKVRRSGADRTVGTLERKQCGCACLRRASLRSGWQQFAVVGSVALSLFHKAAVGDGARYWGVGQNVSGLQRQAGFTAAFRSPQAWPVATPFSPTPLARTGGSITSHAVEVYHV